MLIICSECGKEYSDQAKSCPHCGAITSQNRYISNNNKGKNNNYSYQNNTNNTNGSGCAIVFVIIFALILGFIGLKLLFGGLGKLGLDKDTIMSSVKETWEDDSFWKDDTSSKSSLLSNNKVYNIGEKITTDKFEITVTDVEERANVGTTIFNESAGEGNTFVCVRIKIKNISDKPIGTFSQPSFNLIDSKNVTYSFDISASSYYATEVNTTNNSLSDLNPAVTVTDAYVFEIGKSLYLQNTFNLKISADKTVLVKIK